MRIEDQDPPTAAAAARSVSRTHDAPHLAAVAAADVGESGPEGDVLRREEQRAARSAAGTAVRISGAGVVAAGTDRARRGELVHGEKDDPASRSAAGGAILRRVAGATASAEQQQARVGGRDGRARKTHGRRVVTV